MLIISDPYTCSSNFQIFCLKFGVDYLEDIPNLKIYYTWSLTPISANIGINLKMCQKVPL